MHVGVSLYQDLTLHMIQSVILCEFQSSVKPGGGGVKKRRKGTGQYRSRIEETKRNKKKADSPNSAPAASTAGLCPTIYPPCYSCSTIE